MKPTYLEHPKHGVHIVYDPQELALRMAEGWKLREEKRPEPQPEPKKRGRPRKE